MQIKAFNHHPKLLWVLSFGKLWDTFSYFGTQTILVLYLIHTFHFSQGISYIVYGTYSAFLYATSVFGGYLSDRWFKLYESVFVGNILVVISNILLMLPQYHYFSFGLATSVIGSAIYRSSIMSAIGNLYSKADSKKEMGFTWLYVTTNVGGTLGPLIYGLSAYWLGWNAGFLCSAIMTSVSLAFIVTQRELFKQDDIEHKKETGYMHWGYLILITAILVIGFLFYRLNWLNQSIFVLFSATICFIAGSIYRQDKNERKYLLVLIIMSFLGMFYFAASLQIGASITLFIQQKINEGIIHTALPASTFSMLYPLFVLILAPFTTKIWQSLHNNKVKILPFDKLAMGIGLGAMGIFSFALADKFSFILLWICLGNLLLAAGELVLSPMVYTTISNLSPNNMKSTMMGTWLFFVGFGGYLSGVYASASHYINTQLLQQPNTYFMQFIVIGILTMIIALITKLLVQPLHAICESHQTE